MDARSPVVSALRRAAPLAVAAVILVIHSLAYHFVTDDAYISFVYARNLAEEGALVFNPSRAPVEGYTNFLWTFTLGLLMRIGIPPEWSSLVLGTGFAIGTLIVVYRLSARMFSRTLWDAVPALLLASSAGYACWSSGGLETQMFTFWVTLAIDSYTRADGEARYQARTGIFLALAAMTRPEGLLVTAVVALHRLALNLVRDRRLKPHRFEWSAIGWFLLLWAPWFAWRWWYYGHVFPNTYYVKAAGEASPGYEKAMLDSGLHYIYTWAHQSGALFAAPLALFAAVCRPRSKRFVFATLAIALSLVYLGYTVRVGGDFMGLWRFVMPVCVLVAVLTVAGLRSAIGFVPERARTPAAVAAALLLLGGHAISQARTTAKSRPSWRACDGDAACIAHHKRHFWPSDRGIDTPSYLAVYAHDRKLIGEHMRECFTESDFSIFGGVGAKPYYARTEGIDVFGLVSEEIAHQVPRTRPRAGHNKWGPDARLVEWYDPDFVFSCYSLHQSPGQPSFNCSPGFWRARGYEQVTLHIPGLIERGEYYTFWVAGDRADELRDTCPGVIE